MVSDHYSRWKTLDVAVQRRRELGPLLELGVLERKGGSLIEKIKLEIFNRQRPVEVDLFGGVAPNLHHIALTGIAPRDWSSGIFSGLLSLSLNTVTTEAPLKLSQVIDILRQCPDLSSLELENISIPIPRQQPPPEVVHLAKLHTLTLAYLPTSIIAHILTSLRTPQCVRYECCLRQTSEDTAALGGTLSAFAARVAPRLELLVTSGVHIRMSVYTRPYDDQAPSPIVDVQLHSTPHRQLVSDQLFRFQVTASPSRK